MHLKYKEQTQCIDVNFFRWIYFKSLIFTSFKMLNSLSMAAISVLNTGWKVFHYGEYAIFKQICFSESRHRHKSMGHWITLDYNKNSCKIPVYIPAKIDITCELRAYDLLHVKDKCMTQKNMDLWFFMVSPIRYDTLQTWIDILGRSLDYMPPVPITMASLFTSLTIVYSTVYSRRR